MTVRTTEATSVQSADRAVVVFGASTIGVDEVVAVAEGRADASLSADPQWLCRLEAGRALLHQRLADGDPVYGVSTGVGASVDNEIPGSLQADLARNLFRFHGCGTGAALAPAEAAAVVAARLASLARGYSAVRPVVLEYLVALLRSGVMPRIPEEGSVGASGDLTPLAYVAALLSGEGEGIVDGRVVPGREALEHAGLEPLVLAPKESLALMNGTSVMAGISSLVLVRAERLARAAAAVTAMTSAATRGNPEHFDEDILGLKPHPGTMAVGTWIRAFLGPAATADPARLQDRYSVRCAPHVLGVLVDAAAIARRILDVEIAGVNDNPVVDPDTGRVLHGGNFYGGHVVFALDALKGAIAGAADLLNRQLVLLCMPDTSGGLPANLVATPDDHSVSHHGFKAMQITASALAAEALKTSLPAAVFSRSTESHNQDKVSMGTLASREARRVVELGETVAAVVLLAACQAVDLRARTGATLPAAVLDLHAAVRRHVPMIERDRRQDGDIAKVLELLRAGELPLDPGAPGADRATLRPEAEPSTAESREVRGGGCDPRAILAYMSGPLGEGRQGRRLRETSVEIEVPFHDIDGLGIAWHGHYYKYFEIARTRLLRGVGLDAGDLIGPRYRFLVVESHCRYVSPLRYGDRVCVSAWFGDVRHRIRIAYEATNLATNRRAARGHTILATTDLEGRLLLETPHGIADRITTT